MIEALPVPTISATAELFVAAVLSWIGLTINKASCDPKTPPAHRVLLDLSLGLVAVMALVFYLSAFLKIFF
jgi:hypothetical protein